MVTKTPTTPTATEALLNRIGPIRNTHYGGFYDFTADLSSKDTAYTNLALAPHNDTTYFSEPAGLQMFHMLSHTDGSGGATTVVDGFRAATELRTRDKKAFEALCSIGIYAHSSGNEDVSVQGPAFTVFSTPKVAMGRGMVRWNNDDRVAFETHVMRTPGWVDRWYIGAA